MTDGWHDAHLDDEYGSTRRGWSAIWRDASLDAELGTGIHGRAREIRARYLAYLRRGARLLEAGCGVGTELVLLQAAGYRVIGVDYTLDALRRVPDRPQRRLASADVHQLPFVDGAFEGYLSFGVLEHFRFGPRPALREARRVLMPGGVLVLTVPAPNLVWKAVRAKRRLLATPRPPYYETTYSAAALVSHVKETGFDVQGIWPVGHSFTLWGLGGLFRGRGHYETSVLAERLGRVLARVLPWQMAFASLVVALRPGGTRHD